MKLLIATSNPHKIEEIAAVFAEEKARSPQPPKIELVSLKTAGIHVPEPHEDQPTFEGNAVLKARYYAKASRLTCIADDSGLEVDALNGAPGVISARYAGVNGSRNIVDPANNRLLLENLRGVPPEKRTARFVCTMALVNPSDQCLTVVRGTVEGRIIPDGAPARGSNGFGYDPLFLIDALGKTTAELSPDEKNQVSHRGAASRLMWGELVKLFLSGDAGLLT